MSTLNVQLYDAFNELSEVVDDARGTPGVGSVVIPDETDLIIDYESSTLTHKNDSYGGSVTSYSREAGGKGFDIEVFKSHGDPQFRIKLRGEPVLTGVIATNARKEQEFSVEWCRFDGQGGKTFATIAQSAMKDLRPMIEQKKIADAEKKLQAAGVTGDVDEVLAELHNGMTP
ncbi:hypothetical protein [Sulfitobacter sp. R18_1]|uniref:hypothetical protein n=1 Tax=Sulfitobacter sp. R18_1 TaxID=2821104 RepID=UPI001ADBB6AC|nr:hypothetical protein [Sulfitobacter sp. R18_1]MBO9428159.1 hypothetical protein [Sulfitobacter sp. R18_1]